MAQAGKLLKAVYSPASNLVHRQRGIGCVREGEMNVELGSVGDGHWLETAGYLGGDDLRHLRAEDKFLLGLGPNKAAWSVSVIVAGECCNRLGWHENDLEVIANLVSCAAIDYLSNLSSDRVAPKGIACC